MSKNVVGSILIVVAAAALPARAGVPLEVSHQGAIAVFGERFTGEGGFRFALIDPGTDEYLWVNDASVVFHPDPPVNGVDLEVVNGVYQVDLGDTLLTNMTAIPAAVFSENANVVLRVWFDDQQGNGVHPLSPDLKITASPYAVQASTSEQLNIPGEDTAAVVVDMDGNVGVGQEAPSARLDVEGTTELNGDVTINSNLTVDTNTLFVDGTNGNVGIGTTTPGHPLTFADALGDKISLFGQSDEHYGLGIGQSLLQIYSSTATADIAFGWGSSAAFEESMRVKGNGNVGIGSTLR